LIIEGQRVFDLLKQMLRQNPADRRPAQIMDRIRALPDTAHKVVGSLISTTLPQQPTLRFYGFGPGSAEKDDNPVVWHSAKARYLIFYLLSHPPRSRDQIFRVFWPDAERDAARSAFHWTKSQARRALNRSLIAYQDSLYQIVWDPDCWFDVTIFESLLEEQSEDRQARLEEAVSLYQGDFLEDYDAEWCLPIRERLRIRYRDALLELSECYVGQREFAAAVSVLSRAMAVDDLHEPVIRALMRLYTLDGRPGLALDAFHQLTRRLQRIRAFPEQETQSLYRSIQANLLQPSLDSNPT
jgi:DNA-binding SARP family transcriptional activator